MGGVQWHKMDFYLYDTFLILWHFLLLHWWQDHRLVS